MSKQATFFHLLTGDAIATKDAAARRLLHYMWATASELGFLHVLLVWVCAAHQSNLTVMAAICGSRIKNPTVNNAICAACSRLYRHLMPDYAEEFSVHLWQYVQESVELVGHDDVNQADAEHAAKLQTLYGQDVLPDDLLALYADDLTRPRFACELNTDRDHVCRLFYQALRKHCLVVEENPITSRFWQFGVCVQGLLRNILLGLPTRVFSVSIVKPRPENQKRLKRYHKFYESPESIQTLRVACLSIQLTLHATS